MSDITLDTTLADVVTSVPAAARVLESFGLDYCCHGNRALGDACRTDDVDPEAVLDQLSGLEGGGAEDWTTLDPADLAAHVEATHHAYLHAELPRLAELAAKVAAVHGERHPELRQVQATYGELRAGMDPHLKKEELILFPMIKALAAADGEAAPPSHCGSVASPIAVMMSEHDRDGELLAELRRLTSDYRTPDDGCASYHALYDGLAELEADTHLHIHKENNVLFPAAIALTEQDAPLRPAGHA
jgi:regulator of cell morphogenesis and NO signaling